MVVEQGSCTKESHTTSSSVAKCGNGVGAGPLLSSSSATATAAASPSSPPQTPQSIGGDQNHHCNSYYHHNSNSSQFNHHNHHHNHHHYQHGHQRYSSPVYSPEHARMESWMDENQEFMQDYIIRKATRQVVDAWLVNHATPSSSNNDLLVSPTHHGAGCGCGSACANNCSSRGGSGATTPVR